MFIAILFIISKAWRQYKCPLTVKGINKLLYIHTTLSIKKESAIIHTTAWKNLKNKILSKFRNRLKSIPAI